MGKCVKDMILLSGNEMHLSFSQVFNAEKLPQVC